jgi:hypothetical protein
MILCMKRGCPVDCGSHGKPSCADRLMLYAVLLMLVTALTVSVAAGIRSLRRSEPVVDTVAKMAPAQVANIPGLSP